MSVIVRSSTLLMIAGFCHAATGSSPNIVFIPADDLGWNSTSVAMDPSIPDSKSDYYQTPNLERLAAQGIRFTQAYSAAPVCTPSRRSIHYGMTPARQHGERFPSTFKPADHKSIPQLLKNSFQGMIETIQLFRTADQRRRGIARASGSYSGFSCGICASTSRRRFSSSASSSRAFSGSLRARSHSSARSLSRSNS